MLTSDMALMPAICMEMDTFTGGPVRKHALL